MAVLDWVELTEKMKEQMQSAAQNQSPTDLFTKMDHTMKEIEGNLKKSIKSFESNEAFHQEDILYCCLVLEAEDLELYPRPEKDKLDPEEYATLEIALSTKMSDETLKKLQLTKVALKNPLSIYPCSFLSEILFQQNRLNVLKPTNARA